jgi:tetratricopeptide (TPR) repeat protein
MMNKLRENLEKLIGETFKRLKEKKIDKTSFKNMFKFQIKKYSFKNDSYQKKKNIIFRILLIFLLFGSVIGGYLMMKTLENFTFSKKNDLAQRGIPPQRNVFTKVQETLNKTHSNMEDTKKENIQANKTTNTTIALNATITTNTTKETKITIPSKFPIKTEEVKKDTKATKTTKETKKKLLLAKKPHIAKPEGYSAIYSPQESSPILREEGLFKNLLVNAEEELAKGNYQSAKVFYERYLAKKQDPDVYNNYGSVLFLLGDYKSAEKAFIIALFLRQDPTFKLNLIMTELKLKQYDFACEIFKESQKELERFKETTLIKNICSSKGF